jgi:integrase
MRRVVSGGIRLKHLNQSGRWPSGNPRLYYRPKGEKGVALPDLPPDAPGFLEAYARAAGGEPQVGKPQAEKPHPTGTIGAAIVAYLRSETFSALALSSRMVWRRALDDMRRRYGEGDLVDLRTRHIRIDLAPLAAHPANNRLKVWRSFCRWAVDAGLIDEDPARSVRTRATPKTDGHKAWGREDAQKFRKHWPIGTPERLAFELMYRTCASIGDACTLGPRMIEDGWLSYQRRKSGSVAVCPWTVPAPDWFEANDDLHTALAAQPRHLTFMVTPSGAARSHKGAAQWFSRACTAAGLADLSAHGIRKFRAATFRENGASVDQRMAILGHETQSEAARYSKSADLRRTVSGGESSNFPNRLGTYSEKPS